MEKRFLILVVLVLGLNVKAQKVALHSSSGVQHFLGIEALKNAYNEAQNGDTIYLSGGGTQGTAFNGGFDCDKSLRIYGAGHYPDSTTATGITKISGNIKLLENADGFYLEGVHLEGDLNFNNNTAVDNVTVKYCKIGKINVSGDGTNPSKNILIYNNVVVGHIELQNAQNVVIRNCIITFKITNSNGSIFSNNIMMKFNGISHPSLFEFECNNNYIENNIIFLRGDDRNILISGSGNTFRNNVINSTVPILGGFPTVENNYLGIRASDILVNQSDVDFSYDHDYHLQDPTAYLGTDGTQVGIYGGAYPYKEGAVPSNPHIQEENIAPTVTGGQLNVHIKAAAQDN